jgi:hypothetical protein
MKGDFTRNSFDPMKHFTRVLMQQGRGQLDADFNEQVAILLHYVRTLATDLIGPYGGPIANFGFGVITDPNQLSAGDRDRLTALKVLPLDAGDFLISKGRYYVGGLLCENDYFLTYANQLDLASAKLAKEVKNYVIYLDVYEQPVCAAEDDSIREVALGGPDTAARAKLVWQVRAQALEGGTTLGNMKPSWDALLQRWQPDSRGLLRARARQFDAQETEPCIINPEARYRGAENQLYRVEIHYGSNTGGGPTFKWSRENGSVLFRVLDFEQGDETTVVTLEDVGRDSRLDLAAGNWVEFQHEDQKQQNAASPLLRVQQVDLINRQVTLEGVPSSEAGRKIRNAALRRWDQQSRAVKEGGAGLRDGSVPIQDGQWITLEDGIQVQFDKNAAYRTSDYWEIPARTATGDIIWPQAGEQPAALPPHGVIHHYAPLAVIAIDAAGKAALLSDCRCAFGPRCYGYGLYGFDDYTGIGADAI